MLPPDLIYEISMFLSPKDLVKLSLCSNYLRKYILGNQSIWRTQYYMEWPAFFTPKNSDEDAFFPAPTWLQTFLMRKLSVLNIERQKMREIPCEIDYQFIQDLCIHHDNELKKLTVYKSMHQKVAEYDSMPINFNLYYRLLNKFHCGDSLFAYHNMETSELYCFSLNGECTSTNVNRFLNMISIDKSRFVGTSNGGVVCSYKISPSMEIQQQDMPPLPRHSFAPVNQRPGFFVLADTCWNAFGRVSWCIYDFRQTQPKLVMEREIPTQHKVTEISKFISADPDFIFIPFVSEEYLFVYIYSFKEDRYRIIRIDGLYLYCFIAVFYDSAWGGTFPHNLDYVTSLSWIYFSGTSLDSFTATTPCHIHHAAKFIRISRKVLLITTGTQFSLVNIESGSEIWIKECGYYQSISYNDRYLICSKVLYDFSPDKAPEIQEWLYKLFE